MVSDNRPDDRPQEGGASPGVWLIIFLCIAIIVGILLDGVIALDPAKASFSQWFGIVLAIELAVYVGTLFMPPASGVRIAQGFGRVVVGMALRIIAASVSGAVKALGAQGETWADEFIWYWARNWPVALVQVACIAGAVYMFRRIAYERSGAMDVVYEPAMGAPPAGMTQEQLLQELMSQGSQERTVPAEAPLAADLIAGAMQQPADVTQPPSTQIELETVAAPPPDPSLAPPAPFAQPETPGPQPWDPGSVAPRDPSLVAEAPPPAPEILPQQPMQPVAPPPDIAPPLAEASSVGAPFPAAVQPPVEALEGIDTPLPPAPRMPTPTRPALVDAQAPAPAAEPLEPLVPLTEPPSSEPVSVAPLAPPPMREPVAPPAPPAPMPEPEPVAPVDAAAAVVEPTPPMSAPPPAADLEPVIAPGEPGAALKLPAAVVLRTLPPSVLAGPAEIVAEQVPGGSFSFAWDDIVPQLEQGEVRMPSITILNQVPTAILAGTPNEASRQLPAEGISLPLEEIVARLPASFFAPPEDQAPADELPAGNSGRGNREAWE